MGNVQIAANAFRLEDSSPYCLATSNNSQKSRHAGRGEAQYSGQAAADKQHVSTTCAGATFGGEADMLFAIKFAELMPAGLTGQRARKIGFPLPG